MQFTIGCDPEFFLKEGDNYVSAHDLVPGTKYDPFPLDGGAVQADGTAVEFNILPAGSSEEFSLNISRVLQQIRELVPARFSFYFRPSVEYDPAYFRRIPVAARQLGCDPDYNANLSGKMNKITKRPGTLRTGAGHIHIGWGKDIEVYNPVHIKDCCEAVKYLDQTILPSESHWCDDRKRRTLYGAPGAFRPKNYGVEYRVLSNSWLRYPRLWPWLFESVTSSLEELARGMTPRTYVPALQLLQEETEPWQYHF
jgi:hypothetical protein